MKNGKKSLNWINIIKSTEMIEFFRDFLSYLKERKRWWLIPVIIILLLFGLIIILGSGSALAPFIYTIF